jgi:GNAT superfamily N-acetyltransferase
MEISIREIKAYDLNKVVQLMHDFAAYEDLSDYCTVTVERLEKAMFASGAYVEGLIARDGARPVGYALFYPAFSSFRGERGMYLEDIYVDAEYRRHDLGRRLIGGLARRAVELGFERIDFMVLDWNTPAVNFYLKHGAEKNDDESHFKFSGEAFRRLAKN